MADIPVERRTGNWWMWLVGLIVLVLAIWLAVSLLDGGEGDMEGTSPADEPIEQQEQPPAEQQQEQPPGEQSEAQPPIEDVEAVDLGLVLADIEAPANERNTTRSAGPVHRR